MAGALLSFVGQNSAVGATANLPAGLAVGDMILVYAYNNALGAPSTAAGFTSISTQSANSNAHKYGWRYYDGVITTIGTWTSAVLVCVCVYRATNTVGTASGTTSVSGTTDTISAVSPFTVTNGTSWIVTGAGSAQATSMSTPANTTLRSSVSTTGAFAIMADTNGGVSTFGSNSSTLGGTAVSASASQEITQQAFINFQNYEQLKVGDGMSVSEKIR